MKEQVQQRITQMQESIKKEEKSSLDREKETALIVPGGPDNNERDHKGSEGAKFDIAYAPTDGDERTDASAG